MVKPVLCVASVIVTIACETNRLEIPCLKSLKAITVTHKMTKEKKKKYQIQF